MASLPQFCNQCKNIVGHVNIITDLMKCPNCENLQKMDDRKVAVEIFNKGKRIISDIEAMRLAHEPTTNRIEMECPKCKYPIMAAIRDEDMNFILVCLDCENMFRNSKAKK